MKSKQHFKMRAALLSLFLLVSQSPVFAQQQSVELKATLKGDVLYIDATTKAGEPIQRMNPDPAFLELSFPKGSMSGSALNQAVDKGLVQKVVSSQSADSVVAKVYVVSKPATTLTKTATGYRYAIKLQEMAGAVARPTAAASKPVETPAVASKPPVAPTKPPVTTTPTEAPAKPAVAPSKPVETPAKPTAAATKPVETPAKPAVAATKPVETPAKPAVAPTKPVETPAKPAVAPTKPVETPSKPVAVSTPAAPPVSATPAAPAITREYFPYKTKSAEKAMVAAQLAFPNLSYVVDPVLNILMVEGKAEDVSALEKFLRAQSPK